MAKVANRVEDRRRASRGEAPVKLNSGKSLETKVTISNGFKELRDINRKALISLKH
jgi:hypothetical protein